MAFHDMLYEDMRQSQVLHFGMQQYRMLERKRHSLVRLFEIMIENLLVRRIGFVNAMGKKLADPGVRPTG